MKPIQFISASAVPEGRFVKNQDIYTRWVPK